MNIGEIEIIAKKVAMLTGENQNVLTRDGGFCIQPASVTVPNDWELHSTFSAGIDLAGLAGSPTMSGSVVGAVGEQEIQAFD